MTTRDTNWPEGTPAWADLMVPDGDAAREFYTGLFGWDFQLGDEDTGFYSQAIVDGHIVAGLMQSPPGEETPPPSWTTYLAVDDADHAATAITEAGGIVMMAPMEVMDFGRMAIAADPAGAVFGVWQGDTHTGAQIVNVPGAMVWNETLSHDFDAAKAFYGTVFGYEFQDLSGDGFRYAGIQVDGSVVGGIGQLPEGTPPEVPSLWLTYFQVEDPAATVARAGELGGTIQQDPRDSPYGQLAVIIGPAGETFAVIRPAHPTAAVPT